jgi:S-adenosylmethionine decarboxylase
MADDVQISCPFEGPEKLLEIWFAPSASHVPNAGIPGGKYGLRAVERQIWEDMLEIVKCKVLSVVEGDEIDAYLLRYALFPSALTSVLTESPANPPYLSHLIDSSSKHAEQLSIYLAFLAFLT